MKTPTEKGHVASLYYRNTHLQVVTIVVLLVAGISAIKNLPRLEDPRITQRNATILTFLPGASASRVEALINEKIEVALEEISEIKDIESTARSGVSSIQVSLEDDITRHTNEAVFSKIRSRLQNVQSELPEGATIPFLDDERGAVSYSLLIGLQWQGDGDGQLNLLQRIALDVKDHMRRVPNTELVRIFGDVHEEIIVTPDQAELAELGLAVEDIAHIVKQADSKVSAGQIRGDHHDLPIEVAGALDSLERVGAIPVKANTSGSTLRLGDIADIRHGYRNPPDQIGLKDQKRTIYVAVRAEEKVRLDTWNDHATRVLDQLRKEYSGRIHMEPIFVQSTYTEARLTDLSNNLVAGACIVILVVFLTMGWKSSLIVGSALPLSAAGALFSLSFFDQGIHQMSIFGMIIALGLLIDSAIVMTDEVRKRIRSGASRLDAMESSVRHLFVPLLASTFTTVLGFMPIFLLPGNAGDFVSPIAISVVMALCISFFLAVTVIPALAAKFTNPHDDKRALPWWRIGLPKPKFVDDFHAFSVAAIKKPYLFAALSLVPTVLGFALMPTMSMEFFPAGDRNMFEIQLWTSSENAIDRTEKIIAEIDDEIRELDGVTKSYWLAGASVPAVYYNQVPSQDKNSAYAQAVVVTDSPRRAVQLIAEAQNLINDRFPEVKAVVKSFSQGPPAAAPVAYRIMGPDLHQLRILGEQVRAVMHESPDIVHTRASIEGGEGKLWLNANETEAALVGLDLRDIATQFQANLEGFTGGSILEDVEELPIRVRLPREQRQTISQALDLPLKLSSSAGWVPANALGSLTLRPESGTVTRFNGQRVNTIYGYIVPDAKAVSVSSRIMKQIRMHVSIPEGYMIDVAGDSEEQEEAVGNLAIFAPILFVMMAATLILAFRSAALASIVGLVGLSSVGLGMLSLKIAGYPLGFNPLIGSIGLAGVAINDTIVVLAAIISNEKAKFGHGAAIIEETYGCGRHVLSTTATTIGGLIPLLLLSGGSFWPPLAVVIAGGIGFSLILAMFFTPLCYQIYANWRYGTRSRGARVEVPA
ncbi:efflux RND transporter permease subunit [Sulfidibacter corallicola]|nr:efflux RND transporter permease subunit [Sulfidibacter corallicola]